MTTPAHPLASEAAAQFFPSVGYTNRDVAAAIIDRACRVTERESDHAHAISEAKRRCPNFPWRDNTMSEVVWALGESLSGVTMACDDWSKRDTEREALLAECREMLRELAPRGCRTTHYVGDPDCGECIYCDAKVLLARLDERTPTA